MCTLWFTTSADVTTEAAHTRLQSDMETLRSSTSSSTTEVETLQTEVSRLHASKRDAIALLDSKTTAHDELAAELSVSQQKTIDFRRQVANLEEKQQQANHTINSAKFKESSLQQEIDVLKRNNEWLDTELKSKSAESSKFRKDKNAKISELQRQNEELNNNLASLRKTENSLRGRIDELGRKLEEHLMTIQRMQEEKVRSDDGWRAELDGCRRLAELQEQSAQTARHRVEELDEEIERTREEASEEISAVQSELETERQAKEEAEHKAEELELQMENLQSNASQLAVEESGVATPRRGIDVSGPFGTPMRSRSPALGTPGSRVRTGMSMTQLHSDLNKMKSELEEEKRRSSRFSAALEEMMADLETKAPEIQDLNDDKARLEADNAQIASSLTQANQERDSFRKESRKWQGQVLGLKREGDLLRQQLRDLSLQVKVLTVEVQVRQEGVELSNAERQALQRAASGESDERILDGMTDTGRYISQRLATFRSVFELQEQNTKLLQLTRQLGEQMEGDEAKAKQEKSDQQEAELDTLRTKVTQYKSQLDQLQKQTVSFMKERDTYRRMCAHRGHIPKDADLESMFDETINGVPTPSKSNMNGNFNATQSTQDLAAESRLVKEMQLHFDAFKREAATDHETLRSQIHDLADGKGSLQGDLARAKSQVSIAQERYEMLQANYNMLKTECEELQRRSQSYAETATKQDSRTQQALEDLVQQRETENGLRGENANLKAERDLSKRIQDRLEEENKSLYTERDRLNTLVANTQKLSSERESSFEDQRRRLQSQVNTLEGEMGGIKQKLNDEMESSKNAALRREFDQEQSQNRVNDLMKGLSSTKEELTAAKTHRDQLQARVEELKVELRNAQEHALALQPRPTPRPGTGSMQQDGGALSREQELSIEIADLRRELELAKNELESVKEQVEQYQSISQASEESLRELESAYEEYRDDAEKTSREKDIKIRDLEQRRDEVSSELSITNDELTNLRTKSDNHQAELDRNMAEYEAQIARVADDSERYKATADLRQEDVKAQAAIAQRAQQNYETELIKHGEAARKLQEVRNELNEIRLQVSSSKAEAETARAQLAQSEESWQSAKDQLEIEVTELKRRREDVDRQNQLLHQQLESVSTQIKDLQQRRQSGHVSAHSEGPGELDSSKYQDIIQYLRREKEIVDVQYELSISESRRLKQQLDHSESELSDTRLRLEQERQRQQGQQSYSKLAEAINQLNVFRESNETLRGEARMAQAQLAETSKKVDELNAQIEPLRASVQELEDQQETAQGEMKLLQEDRDRWQKRTQDILSKYDRVDPAEMQELKEKLKSLEQERGQIISDRDALQERVRGFDQELDQGKETVKKETINSLREQFKSKHKEVSDRLKNVSSEKQVLQDQIEQIRGQLTQAQQQVAEAIKQKDGALAEARQAHEQAQRVQPQAASAQTVATQTSPEPENNATADTTMQDNEEGEVDESTSHRLQDAEARIQQESARAADLENTVNELEDQIQTLQTQADELRAHLDTERAKVHQLRQPQSTESAWNANNAEQSAEHMQKLQDDLAAAQQEVEALRQNSASTTETSATVDNGDTDTVALRAQLEQEYQQKAEAAQRQADDRSKQMKDQLNKRLRETREKERNDARQAVQTEHDAQFAKLKQEHDAMVTEMKARHIQEIEQAKSIVTHDTEAKGLSAAPSDAADAQAQVDTHINEKDLPTEPAAIKNFVATNPTVSGIIRRSVDNKIKAERESLETRISELEAVHKNELAQIGSEHEAKVKDLQETTEKAKMQAVAMAEKKSQVKLNMAIKARDEAKAKIEFVQKAANDTPAQPVGEVWNAAKNVKPQLRMQSVQVQTPAAQVSSTAAKTTQSVQVQVKAEPTSAPGGGQEPPATTKVRSEPISPPNPYHIPFKRCLHHRLNTDNAYY